MRREKRRRGPRAFREKLRPRGGQAQRRLRHQGCNDVLSRGFLLSFHTSDGALPRIHVTPWWAVLPTDGPQHVNLSSVVDCGLKPARPSKGSREIMDWPARSCEVMRTLSLLSPAMSPAANQTYKAKVATLFTALDAPSHQLFVAQVHTLLCNLGILVHPVSHPELTARRTSHTASQHLDSPIVWSLASNGPAG